MTKYWVVFASLLMLLHLSYANYEILEYFPATNTTLNTTNQVKTLYMISNTAYHNYTVYFHDAQARDQNPVDLYINNSFALSGNTTTVIKDGRGYYKIDILFVDDADAVFRDNVFYLPKTLYTKYRFTLRNYEYNTDYNYIVEYTGREDPVIYMLTPKNMSSFSLKRENLTQTYDLYIEDGFEALKSIYIEYPYAVNLIDGSPNLYPVCIENCNTNETFYVDLGSVDVSDNFFYIVVKMRTQTPIEWVNQTFAYYLDSTPPRVIEYSSFPPNNTVRAFQDHVEINLTRVWDVRENFPSCTIKIYEKRGSLWVLSKQYNASLSSCTALNIPNLNQTDYKIGIVLYDYANNSKAYWFYYYRDSEILDCYFNSSNLGEMWCYYKTKPQFKMYVDYDKRRNIVLGENLTLKLVIPVSTEGIKKIILHNIDRNVSLLQGCDNFHFYWNNKTLSCANNISLLELYGNPNATLNPFNVSLVSIEQDTSYISSMFGDTFVKVNFSIKDMSSLIGIASNKFFNVTYNFTALLKTLLPHYVPVTSPIGNINISWKEHVVVVLKATNRIYSLYDGDYYISEDLIALAEPLNVKLNQKVYNKDSISFKNVVARFPMKINDVINESSCMLIHPKHLTIGALETKYVVAEYSCDLFNTSTSTTKTKVSKNSIKVSHVVKFFYPSLPFFIDKTFYYSINTNNLEEFNKRKAISVYLNSIGNDLNYSVNGDILKIYVPASELYEGEHRIYIDYWYDIEEQEPKEEKKEEKKEKIRNEEKKDDNVKKETQNKEKKHRGEINKTTPPHREENKTHNLTAQDILHEGEKIKRGDAITGKIISEITSSKNLKVLAILLLVGIAIYLWKTRHPAPKSSRREYLNSLKKEVL